MCHSLTTYSVNLLRT